MNIYILNQFKNFNKNVIISNIGHIRKVLYES